MARLILIRHAETDWNLEGRWQGQADVPLNVSGLKQAERMAKTTARLGLTALYSSDLRRATQTAEAIARQTGLAIQFDPRLREIDQGEWEGMFVEDIQTRYADIFQRRKADPWGVSPPGGETALQVNKRVLAAIRDIIQQHPEGVIGIVSHGFSLAVTIAHYQGHPINEVWNLIPENCQVIEIEGVHEKGVNNF